MNNSTIIHKKYQISSNHLLIIGILSISFSISFLLRILPGNFAWELHEFDPFFNFRATHFLIENGINEYFLWHDDLSWYPWGRNISETSQVMLHITTAVFYSIFNFGTTLYDFVVIFPVVIGSATSIVIFFLVRIIGNTTAGLISSLLFSISFPILVRGSLGWFKSEPLGLFFGLIGVCLLISCFKRHEFSWKKLPLSALFLSFGLSAWGGDQFFIIVIGLFLIINSFFNKNYKNNFLNILTYSASIIFFSIFFERSSINFFSNMSMMLLIVPLLLSTVSIFVHKKSKVNKSRNSILVISILIIIITSSLILLDEFSLIKNPAFRYLNAINPFLTTTDPLVDSISEHATTNIQTSFMFHGILMVFSGLGIWFILTKSLIKNEMRNFLLIFILFGVYISSTFARLEVFAACSLVIISGISLSFLIKQLSRNHIKSFYKIIFFIGIIFLFSFSIIPFQSNSTYAMLTAPPTIYNGGTQYITHTNDWLESLDWIKNNTPKNSIIASWWDYGYWIQTMGERTTLIDNATLIDHSIKGVAKTLFDDPDSAWKYFNDREVDYFLVFLAGQRFPVDDNFGEPLYYLGGGGEESKKVWIARVGGIDENVFMYSDKLSATPEFWKNTFFGKIIPFELITYVKLGTTQQSLEYVPGYDGIYYKKIKFDENDPFRLVYTSPGMDVEKGEFFTIVLIYELNKNYSISN